MRRRSSAAKVSSWLVAETANRPSLSRSMSRSGPSGSGALWAREELLKDIPPFMIADGNPAKVRGINLVGLERSGFPPESVKWIKEAFRLIYRKN